MKLAISLSGRLLNSDEKESYYDLPVDRKKQPLYEHCVRAINMAWVWRTRFFLDGLGRLERRA